MLDSPHPESFLNPELEDNTDAGVTDYIRSSLPFQIWRVLRENPHTSFNAVEMVKEIERLGTHHNRVVSTYATALSYLGARNLAYRPHSSDPTFGQYARWQIVSVTEPYRNLDARARRSDEQYVRIRQEWPKKAISPQALAWSSAWRFGDFWLDHTRLGRGRTSR